MNLDYYPPAPSRAVPDWEGSLVFSLNVDEWWLAFLLKDVYAAVGLKSYSLAAMGARAIVDTMITAEAGDSGGFRAKLNRLADKGIIDSVRANAIYAVFDAASATAHRGHKPDENDLFTLLTIMESLLYEFRVKPEQHRQQAREAERLKLNTPQRPRRKTT